MGPSRPNPAGGWVLRSISLSQPHLARPIRKHHRNYEREY